MVTMSDEGDKARRPTKVRVEFAVGSQEDGRWITFGDDVELYNIAEWFRFTGEAITRMFNTGHVAAQVRLRTNGPNKINTIKIVREHLSCGLKEAKDAVEGVYGGLVGVFEDDREARDFIRKLEEVDNTCATTGVVINEHFRSDLHERHCSFLLAPKRNPRP